MFEQPCKFEPRLGELEKHTQVLRDDQRGDGLRARLISLVGRYARRRDVRLSTTSDAYMLATDKICGALPCCWSCVCL